MNNRVIAAIITALTISAVTAAAKSFVDVERLKTKFDYLMEDVDEIKSDIKWMRRNWRQKE